METYRKTSHLVNLLVMNSYSKHAALFLMGFFAIAAQILLIRELLITFSGNELSIGLFLANWLLLEAIGSFSAARLANKIKSSLAGFAGFQFLLALLFPVTIYLARSIKFYSGLMPAEIASLPVIFISSLVLLAPVALINGAQFTLGCRLTGSEHERASQTIGRVYMIESLGSILAGLAVTYFFLQYLNNFQAAFLLSILNSGSALFLLFAGGKSEILLPTRRFLQILHTLLLIFTMLMISSDGISSIQYKSTIQRSPGYRLIDYQNSIFGNTTLLWRAGQYDLISNGVPFLSLPVPDIAGVEEKVHLTLLTHPNPKSVFLVGGGAGGMLREILKHPVDKIDYTELDPNLIRILEGNLPDSALTGLHNSRVRIHYSDGRHFLRTHLQKYDLILLNLPDPSTLVINRFYTQEFFYLCRSRLRQNGILVFNLPGSASYMNQTLARLNACISETAASVFKFQRVFAFETNLFLLSEDAQVMDITADRLDFRSKQRQLKTHLLNPSYFRYKLNHLRETEFREELQRNQAPGLNSDFKPLAVFLDILQLNDSISPAFSSVYNLFRYLKLYHLLLLILLLFSALYIYQRKQKSDRRVPVRTVIFSTGFAGMGVSMIMILSFQSLFGYVYFWIGMIITGFMSGMTIGSFFMMRQLSGIKNPERFLFGSEVGHTVYFFILAGGLTLLTQSPISQPFLTIAPYGILVLTSVSGFLTGWQFPLANQVYLSQKNSITQSAGTLYAADLAGAWLAGITVTLLMIPILGLLKTAILLLSIKCFSACLVWQSGSRINENTDRLSP